MLLLEKSQFLVQKIRIDFPKVPWMPKSLSGSVVWWWGYMQTNVYAVHACGLFIISHMSSATMVNSIIDPSEYGLERVK